MSSRASHSHSRTFLGFRWTSIPRDYLERRRWFRRVSDILMILLLSILVAGVILYTSSPKAGAH